VGVGGKEEPYLLCGGIPMHCKPPSRRGLFAISDSFTLKTAEKIPVRGLLTNRRDAGMMLSTS